MLDENLSLLEDLRSDDRPTFARNSLREQVTDLLRSYIVAGRIAPGSRLAEAKLAEWLGVSRAPVHDALCELEKEGLAVNTPAGRYLVELDERDVRELGQVRSTLEILAGELAAQHTTPERAVALSRALDEMNRASVARDAQAYARCDLAIHQLIWQQANNRHLATTLGTVTGPVFMLSSRIPDDYRWEAVVDLHDGIVASINAGNLQATRDAISHHMETTLSLALATLQILQSAATSM